MLAVSDILRHKGSAVVTVDPALTVQALASVLAERRVGSAVVSADGIHVEGIVSERDIVRALASDGPDILTGTVSQICTREVEVVAPGDKLDEIMRIMTERRFRHLPVVVDGELSGLVSIGDIVKARVGELEMEQERSPATSPGLVERGAASLRLARSASAGLIGRWSALSVNRRRADCRGLTTPLSRVSTVIIWG